MEKVTTSTEARYLKCEISDEEKVALSEKIAAKEAQKESILSEKAAAVAAFTSRFKIVEEEIKELAAAINQGGVHRNVEVVLKRDYNEMTYSETRADTGEVLVLRDLTGPERQMPIAEEEGESNEEVHEDTESSGSSENQGATEEEAPRLDPTDNEEEDPLE